MSPAHLTGSNRKVPKDIWLMNEHLCVDCRFVQISSNLGVNKSKKLGQKNLLRLKLSGDDARFVD